MQVLAVLPLIKWSSSSISLAFTYTDPFYYLNFSTFFFFFFSFGQVSLASCWFTRENRTENRKQEGREEEFTKRCQHERNRALLLCYLNLPRQVAAMQSLFYIQTLLLSCRSHFYCVRHLISSIFFLIHNLVSNYSNYSFCLMSAISFQYLLFSNSISYHRLSSYFQP